MAALWQMLREEVQGTVSEFREKGAVGAFRDAALDAYDMVADAGSFVMNEASNLVSGDDEEDPAIYALRLPEDGEQVQVHVGNELIPAEVLALDTVSKPPRAKVRVTGEGGTTQVAVVPVLPMEMKPTQAAAAREAPPQQEQVGAEQATTGGWMLDGLRQEWNNTVQDIREKGALGSLRDATLDAVDLLGEAGSFAVSQTKAVTSDALDLLTGDDPPPAANTPAIAAPGGAMKPQTTPLRDADWKEVDTNPGVVPDLRIPAGTPQYIISDTARRAASSSGTQDKSPAAAPSAAAPPPAAAAAAASSSSSSSAAAAAAPSAAAPAAPAAAAASAPAAQVEKKPEAQDDDEPDELID